MIPFLAPFVVAGALALYLRRRLNQPLTEFDKQCSRMDALIEQQERARTDADYQWAHVESGWLAFINQWPVLEETS